MNERLAQVGSWLWRRTACLRSRAGLVILAVAVVGLRLLWIHLERPAHLESIASMYGSVRSFYGPVWLNHDGSQLIYVAPASDRGRAVFLCDTTTGKKRQIAEDKQGVGIWGDDFNVQAGPWSPDDKYFLCRVGNRLMVCSTNAPPENAVIDDAPFTSEAVWLTPTRFACVTGQTDLGLGEKRADGQWERHLILSREVPMTSLTAIGPNSVAWLEDGAIICRADLRSGDASSPNSNQGGAAPSALSATGASRAQTQPPTNGLVLWLDASQLRQADQSQVMGLSDLSRKRNDTVWNGGPPVFNGTNSPLALNGLGTIHFGWLDSATNGTGLKTRAPIGITGAAPRSMFVVMRHDGDRPMMVSMGDTSVHGALFAVEWSDKLYLPTGWWADNFFNAVSTNWNLLEVVHDGASQRGYVNGELRGTASAKLNTVERGVEIGFRDGQDAKAAEGDFAELLIYDRALNFAERQQAEDYLNVKWFGKESLSPQIAQVWHDPGLKGMTGLAYARETGELLISRTNSARDSIWLLNAADGANAAPTQIKEAQSARDPQWAGPNQFIYASRLDTRFRLALADLAGNDKKQLLQLWGNGSFEWFQVTPDQKQVFLLGKLNNASVPGIYRNDLASGEWHPVISSSDRPTPLAPAVESSSRNLSMAGSSATYTFFRPANYDAHKKHPLVIGDTVITDPIYGESFMTSMAACGACVAVVGRPYWDGGIQQWGENVQLLFEQLKHDPSVDASRVYLFAASAETYYLSQFLKTNSAPWRGVILLNPGMLPDFSKSPWFQSRPKMLIDAGGEEHEEGRFQKYQKESLNSGVVVEFYTHPGETHRTVGIIAKLQRARELKHFIFEE
jgi:hypothetical protein